MSRFFDALTPDESQRGWITEIEELDSATSGSAFLRKLVNDAVSAMKSSADNTTTFEGN